MRIKMLSLDCIPIDSVIQVGSQKYANLFKDNGYEVFSLSNFVNLNRYIRRNPEDKELIKAWKKGVQISKEGVYFYTPFCPLPYLNLPVFDSLKIARNCLRFSYPSLARILKCREFVDIDILFINNIRLVSVLRFVTPKIIIYRISDRIEGFNNMPKTILSLQREIIEISDIVIATSRNLQKEAQKIKNNSYYLPNGIDEDFIIKDNEIYVTPEEYKDIKKPIVLYIGAISDWFDYELYEYGVAKLKDTFFVIIGPIGGTNYRENLAKVQQYTKTYQNFRYLGPKLHIELKPYLRFAHIGIIPFKVTPLTNEINPIKFFEYCSFGLPTVASSTHELKQYLPYVTQYANKEEYVNSIRDLLSHRYEGRQKLIDLAKENTWKKRFTFILNCLGEKCK